MFCYRVIMNKLLILLALFIFSCSAPPVQKLVRVPTLYTAKNYSNKLYNEPFFKEEHFSYIPNKTAIDSIKRYHTSETTVIENNVSTRFFRNCDVTISKDSLFFKLTDTPFSRGFYEMKFIKLRRGVDAAFYQTFSVADSSYKLPVFKTINKKVFLDKNVYVKGDSLKAKFSVQIMASYSWVTKYTDTIFVYGFAKTIVKYGQ